MEWRMTGRSTTGPRRSLRLRLSEAGEVAAGDLAQHRQRLADSVPVAAKGADDVREDCRVMRARHAVLGAGGHHEGGKSAQIPLFCGRQFGSGIVDRAHRTAPMVRPRTKRRNGRI